MKSGIVLSCILGTLLALTSCRQHLEKEVVSTWPDGKPLKVQYYKKEGAKRTKVKEIRYYQNGQKEMEGEYADGKKTGLWTAWFESGLKQSEGHYENGLRNGKSVVWRRNGFKFYEGSYSKGKLHGTWIFYDTTGGRDKEVYFEHGEKIREVLLSLSSPAKE